MKKTGVLLINLGTPHSPAPKDVYRYLIEFLTDERVMDLSWLRRELLVRGVIVPFRYRITAKAYQKIWTAQGSPLMLYGNLLKAGVQKQLGDQFHVELAMRYQSPSIKEKLDQLMQQGIDHLIVLPLFPQYASATTGSVLQKVQTLIGQYNVIPKVTLISSYPTDSGMIEAFYSVATQFELNQYDQILFSFHGLPERHINKANPKGNCLKADCCKTLTAKNSCCYSAQCYATADAIANRIGIPKDKSIICFQSRLGKDPWLSPSTNGVIHDLAKKGKKKLLVFCPSFVSDCLETLYEIGEEYNVEFKKAGGTQLDLVPGLNDHPKWIDAVTSMIQSNA